MSAKKKEERESGAALSLDGKQQPLCCPQCKRTFGDGELIPMKNNGHLICPDCGKVFIAPTLLNRPERYGMSELNKSCGKRNDPVMQDMRRKAIAMSHLPKSLKKLIKQGKLKFNV